MAQERTLLESTTTAAPVGRTEFVRASRHPSQVSELRYDAYERLAALGIVPRDLHTHESSLEDIFVSLVHRDRGAA